MARIKIKCRNPSKEQKLRLTEIICSNDIEISRVYTAHDGFAVLTVNEHHADCIFQSERKNELESNGFYAVMPPDLKAKKSVIIPRVDDLIYDNDILDIGEELLKHNTWIGNEDLCSVYKFPNSSTIKLTFTQTTLAKRCTERGLKAFGISIPAHEIKLETYIPVKCCMKCYVLEDHFTNEYPKPKDYKVCSECNSYEHVWHQCKESKKTCLNCGEGHSTLAMKCKKRKQILKEKRNEVNERQKMTYSAISQTNLPSQMSSTKTPTVTKEELLKIHICVAHAQAKNQENPGSYSYELNKVLTANKLPNIIIPNDSNNVPLNNVPVNTLTTPVAGAASISAQSKVSETRTPPPRQSKQSNLDSPRLNKQSNVDSPITQKIDSKDIGLEFFTTKEKGWPANFSTEELVKGIQHNKYKFKYTCDKLSEEQVLRKTGRGEINLSNCWYSVEDDEFRKIRSGLIQERSPVPNRDPRLMSKKINIQ